MQPTSDFQYLTPNLLLTRQETDILDCLTDHGEMPADFDENHVRSFFVGKDFHLVLYFPHTEDRGFQMFVVRDFSIHMDELFILKSIFQRLIQQGHNVAMLKKAHYRVDHLIHMAGTFRALMHSGEPEPTDDYLPGRVQGYDF
ncbi:hypothetical protein [Arundinibacter roseus]|uniref:Uncharacterized protein n=1 Tax=Arundinibacter roseus TaxID=2070510 RepID=A0A4R4K2G3_9BACT|nr:hypothetical protein [Arundinibacter roseus]TDB61403.1 hypothetical protein EZE20_19555 [Arundinibacter roseus]